MALKTPPALAPVLALLAVVLVLGACGGGSTAGPVAATTDAAAPAVTAPAATAPPRRTPPPATQTSAQRAPTPTSTPPPQMRRGHTGPSGGATAEDASEAEGASPGSSAAAAGEPAPAPAPATPTTEQPAAAEEDPQPAASPLDETAELTLVNRISPAHYIQQGTVTGTYDGTMEVEARITSKGVLVRFTATLPDGTISGKGIAVAILDSVTWPGLRGTAAVTGGTGRFADIRGRRLRITGRARPDASRARVRLAGTVQLR